MTDISPGKLSLFGLDPATSRVLVVGLGHTGLSIARFLARRHVEIAVVDSRRKPPCLPQLMECLPDAALFLGGFEVSAFRSATHFFVSPGVSLAESAIARARQAGLPILSDIDLFAVEARAPVVAITGSNGKSTVTTLVGLMVERAGLRAGVGGNLGTPALDLLDHGEPDFYVLELSSFQLERMSRLEPAVATVLNISADHMDRYPDLNAYAEAKRRIFRGRGVMVLNQDDAWVRDLAFPGRPTVGFGLGPGFDYGVRTEGGEEWMTRHGETVMRTGDLRIQGRHNVANALAALALGDAIHLPLASMVEALRVFRGLEHRMQKVAEKGGVLWINDSKATNVGACVAALQGARTRVVLLAGGDGKGADFSDLVPLAAEKTRAVVLMGKDADRLAAVLKNVVTTVKVDSMHGAVRAAYALARPGDTVLLSPACSSLDQYSGFAERGRAFAEAVGDLRV